MFKRIYIIVKRRVKRKLLVAIYRRPRVVKASTADRAQHYIDNHGCPTTRTFPRTTQEAFAHLGENSEWFFPPEQRMRDKSFFWFGVISWVLLSIYLWRQ